MCLKYVRGQKITEKDGNEEQILLFKNIAKEKIDKLIEDKNSMPAGDSNNAENQSYSIDRCSKTFHAVRCKSEYSPSA